VIRILPLEKSHDSKQFDCTQEWMVEEEDKADAADMNAFLQRRALDQAKREISKTFVVLDTNGEEPNRILAYYSTSVGHLQPDDIPKVVSSSMTIPVIHLLRLAVDKQYQGKGIGKRLLAYFFTRAILVAQETGTYAVVLEPLNDQVRDFYDRFGFQPLPHDNGRMYLSIRDARAWLQARTSEPRNET
jgi:GNAT superfamily N-acetyltransferase